MSKQKKQVPGPAQITLVIPARGEEPLLQRTIDHAERTAGCEAAVIVVDNGLVGPEPCGRRVTVVRPGTTGTSAARHVGVMLATTDVVVTIDAHVRLERFWGDRVLEAFAQRGWGQTVACGHVGHLGADFEPTDEPCYHGAKINWMDTSAEPRPLVARWDAAIKPGDRIGAIMGAYYAFRRDWYDAMCQPWQVNRSWGCDEETLSLASWLTGGDCRSLPEECRSWHWFRKSSRVPYTIEEIMEIGMTRARLAAIYPFDATERHAICAFIGYAALPPLHTDTLQTYAECYAGARPALETYLRERVTGYSAWRADLEQAAAAAAAAAAAPAAPSPALRIAPLRLATIPADICDQCDARNSFRVVSTGAISRYKCARCGRNAWRIRDGQIKCGTRND
jgi:hypothetical protein